MKDHFASRRNGVTVPTIWIAVALSVLVHVALMWKWLPNIHFPSPELDERGQASGSIVVQLAPPPRPPSAPSSAPTQAQPAPAQPPPARPAPRRPQTSPPVLALRTPPPTKAPALTVPVPAPPVAVPPLSAPASGDFAANVAARQRARGDTASPTAGSATNTPASEDDKARANRLATANLATQRKQTFGYDPSQGGGVFQIVRIGFTDAEFMFFGWNKDIRRNTKQLIEVQKGSNADTRIAVVRKMISIIRDHELEDFLWESQRLGRNLMLSARPRDNAGLEEFLMREFFEDPRRPQPQ